MIDQLLSIVIVSLCFIWREQFDQRLEQLMNTVSLVLVFAAGHS
jgi:hypothetical protein